MEVSCRGFGARASADGHRVAGDDGIAGRFAGNETVTGDETLTGDESFARNDTVRRT